MQVKLISFSKPSKELISEGLYDVQELIAFCDRVSNPSNQNDNLISPKKVIKLKGEINVK